MSMKKEKQPASKYYTEEHPSGPWSRALYEKRTRTSFNEEDFKNQSEEKNPTCAC